MNHRLIVIEQVSKALSIALLLLTAAPVWAAEPSAPPAAIEASPPPLIPMVGVVSKQGILMLTCSKDAPLSFTPFDPNPDNNQIIFQGVQDPINPQLVSWDGRTLMVPIPAKAI
jgi:hypothetical protein